MCYTVEVIEEKSAAYGKRYQQLWGDATDKSIQLPVQLPLFYFVSGFSHPQLPFVTHQGISLFAWGLIPLWVKDLKQAAEMQNRTLNAMGETVFEKPSFRSVSKKRGLLGINGFYEWRDINKKKYPYLIQLKEEGLFSLGCIYESWVCKETGELFNTFSIITTPANPMMEQIHNLKKRMPLIINREDEVRWVDPELSTEQIKQLIKPFPESKMEAYTVSNQVNNARNERNIPEIIEKVKYPELELI